jgi:hypothetical protein
MRHWLLSIAVCFACACGGGSSSPPPDAAPPPDAPPVTADAAPPDASVSPTSACLDRPTDLARVPTTVLPCELLPPGL